jgi:hypothetical protein
MPDQESSQAPQQPEETSNTSDLLTPPAYKKPILRKYDQIEQVKPYGPSEMEAS